MKITQTLLTAAAISCFAYSASAQIASFDFAGGSLADSASTTNLVVSDVSTGSSFNSFTDVSGWDSAAQISGASSFFSDPTTQAAAGDAIIFTITAASGFQFSITGFSFQARSTSAAPADIGFDINGTPNDFSSSYSNNSTITLIADNSLGFSELTFATISIQGWNSSGSSALQLDNIEVTGLVSPVPEPNTYALLAGICALGYVMTRRRSA